MFSSQPLPIFARLLLGLLPLCWTCYFPSIVHCTLHLTYCTCHSLFIVHVTSLLLYILLLVYCTYHFRFIVHVTFLVQYLLLSLHALYNKFFKFHYAGSPQYNGTGGHQVMLLLFFLFFFFSFFFLEKIVAFISAYKHTPGQRYPCASWLCMWLPLLS